MSSNLILIAVMIGLSMTMVGSEDCPGQTRPISRRGRDSSDGMTRWPSFDILIRYMPSPVARLPCSTSNKHVHEPMPMTPRSPLSVSFSPTRSIKSRAKSHSSKSTSQSSTTQSSTADSSRSRPSLQALFELTEASFRKPSVTISVIQSDSNQIVFDPDLFLLSEYLRCSSRPPTHSLVRIDDAARLAVLDRAALRDLYREDGMRWLLYECLEPIAKAAIKAMLADSEHIPVFDAVPDIKIRDQIIAACLVIVISQSDNKAMISLLTQCITNRSLVCESLIDQWSRHHSHTNAFTALRVLSDLGASADQRHRFLEQYDGLTADLSSAAAHGQPKQLSDYIETAFPEFDYFDRKLIMGWITADVLTNQDQFNAQLLINDVINSAPCSDLSFLDTESGVCALSQLRQLAIRLRSVRTRRCRSNDLQQQDIDHVQCRETMNRVLRLPDGYEFTPCCDHHLSLYGDHESIYCMDGYDRVMPFCLPVIVQQIATWFQ